MCQFFVPALSRARRDAVGFIPAEIALDVEAPGVRNVKLRSLYFRINLRLELAVARGSKCCEDFFEIPIRDQERLGLRIPQKAEQRLMPF